MTRKEKLKLAKLYKDIDEKQATIEQLDKSVSRNDSLLKLFYIKQGIVQCINALDIQEEIAELSTDLN